MPHQCFIFLSVIDYVPSQSTFNKCDILLLLLLICKWILPYSDLIFVLAPLTSYGAGAGSAYWCTFFCYSCCCRCYSFYLLFTVVTHTIEHNCCYNFFSCCCHCYCPSVSLSTHQCPSWVVNLLLSLLALYRSIWLDLTSTGWYGLTDSPMKPKKKRLTKQNVQQYNNQLSIHSIFYFSLNCYSIESPRLWWCDLVYGSVHL